MQDGVPLTPSIGLAYPVPFAAATAVAIVVAIGFFLVRARALRRFRTTIVTMLVVGTAPVLLCVLRLWRFASGEPHRIAASPVAFGIAALLVLLILGAAGRLWQQRWHRADLLRASLGAASVVLLLGVGIVFTCCGGFLIVLTLGLPSVLTVFSIWPDGYDAYRNAGIIGPITGGLATFLVWAALLLDLQTWWRGRRGGVIEV